MKVVLCLFACLSLALAMPQREGAAFTNDAIKQAQQSALIPKGATIQNVSRGQWWPSWHDLILLSFLRCKRALSLPPSRTFPSTRRSTWESSWANTFHSMSSQVFKDKLIALSANRVWKAATVTEGLTRCAKQNKLNYRIKIVFVSLITNQTWRTIESLPPPINSHFQSKCQAVCH